MGCFIRRQVESSVYTASEQTLPRHFVSEHFVPRVSVLTVWRILPYLPYTSFAPDLEACLRLGLSHTTHHSRHNSALDRQPSVLIDPLLIGQVQVVSITPHKQILPRVVRNMQ